MPSVQLSLGWILTSLLFLILAQPTYQKSIFSRQSSGLQWEPCVQELGAVDGVVCANFTVPLDWTNPSDGRSAYLYVAKLPARHGRSLGTIFTNPGGPGGSGASFVANGSELLSDITNGRFDIVGWDPRGVGYTIPTISCATDSISPSLLNLNDNLLQSTLNAPSSGPTQPDIDAFLRSAPNVEAYFKSFVQSCVDKNQDNLKYVGTVATARDLAALADAIDGPGSPIHYWGMSYGTVIGSYLLDLFPERAGRVVLDGILDATAYSQQQPYKMYANDIQDADMALDMFYYACAEAGPSLCSISTPGASAVALRQWGNNLVDAAYTAVQTDVSNPDTPILVRYQLSNAARTPDIWKRAAKTLSLMYQALLGSNGTSTDGSKEVRRATNRSPHPKRAGNPTSIESLVFSPYAIWCGDAIDNTNVTTTDVFEEIVRVTRDVSSIHGPLGIAYPSTFCHLWPARAVERHYDQGIPQLANPVLVIGNTYDVITPLAYAHNLFNRLNANGSKQAVLIQNHGTGHLATAMSSSCTYDIIKKYFVEGVVPEDTLCKTNFNGFLNSYDGSSSSATLVLGPISIFRVLVWSCLSILLGSLVVL